VPKHTSAGATSQVPGLRERISRALRRHLIGIALGGSLVAALVAPSVSLAATPQVRIAPQTAAHSLLIADGPYVWCGGVPIPC
jgi:hypothetical protein